MERLRLLSSLCCCRAMNVCSLFYCVELWPRNKEPAAEVLLGTCWHGRGLLQVAAAPPACVFCALDVCCARISLAGCVAASTEEQTFSASLCGGRMTFSWWVGGFEPSSAGGVILDTSPSSCVSLCRENQSLFLLFVVAILAVALDGRTSILRTWNRFGLFPLKRFSSRWSCSDLK